MTSFDDIMIEITPQVLLEAYSCGTFPMAESAEDPSLYWIVPQQRGVLPLNEVHIPSRLARTIRQERFEIRIDTDYDGTMDGCAGGGPDRRATWINARIRSLYRELFELGHCHTVETWLDNRLVGGLYGVHLGGVFFGESMFSRERDASKVALAHLIARLITGGFQLLDTQFITEHLRQFGAREVSRVSFEKQLGQAIQMQADFERLPLHTKGAEIIAIIAANAAARG